MLRKGSKVYISVKFLEVLYVLPCVPSYNSIKYIRLRAASILSQTHYPRRTVHVSTDCKINHSVIADFNLVNNFFCGLYFFI